MSTSEPSPDKPEEPTPGIADEVADFLASQSPDDAASVPDYDSFSPDQELHMMALNEQAAAALEAAGIDIGLQPGQTIEERFWEANDAVRDANSATWVERESPEGVVDPEALAVEDRQSAARARQAEIAFLVSKVLGGLVDYSQDDQATQNDELLEAIAEVVASPDLSEDDREALLTIFDTLIESELGAERLQGLREQGIASDHIDAAREQVVENELIGAESAARATDVHNLIISRFGLGMSNHDDWRSFVSSIIDYEQMVRIGAPVTVLDQKEARVAALADRLGYTPTQWEQMKDILATWNQEA